MDDDLGQWRTRAIEDFLRTVYLLQKGSDPISITLISQSLHIKADAICNMIRRLESTPRPSEPSRSCYPPVPLVEHQPHHGVRLTKVGEVIALQIMRRHRLLKLYLVKALGFTWDEVESEADRLEHDLSAQLTERLSAALGNPEVDPHGEPIPTAEGKLSTPVDVSLADAVTGQSGILTRVVDHSPELLRYLADLGLHLGTELRVFSRSPLGDTVTIQSSTFACNCILSTEVAGHLRLTIGGASVQEYQGTTNAISRIALKMRTYSQDQ